MSILLIIYLNNIKKYFLDDEAAGKAIRKALADCRDKLKKLQISPRSSEGKAEDKNSPRSNKSNVTPDKKSSPDQSPKQSNNNTPRNSNKNSPTKEYNSPRG